MVNDHGDVARMRTMAISRFKATCLATARYYNLVMLTSDERLLTGEGFSVLANR